jgi:general secretion pathway protein A
MYNEHWKLSQRPFENRIDAQFYYPAESHQAALLKLRYAIENRRSAALLCGPGGSGKSLIVDSLRRQLSEQFKPVMHVVFPALSREQLIRHIVDQFSEGSSERAALGSSRCMADDLNRFERFLQDNVKAERHAVIVIDEAHLLEQHDLLEPLRLLLNVAAGDSQGESAWTLVLVGQPTLLSQVERYQALDERLAVKCMLNRLSPEETNAYIQHRLRAAGVDADDVFDYTALERIHLLTQGIPRRINRMCDLALMVGYAEDRQIITSEVVDNVHSDLAAPSIV